MSRSFCVSSSTKSCFLFSSKRKKILATIFTLFSTHSEIVFSQPPTAFTGDVLAPCPANFTCSEGIADQGILQRQITDANGDTYIQLIVSGVDGVGTSVTNESFIKMNAGNNDGISSRFDMSFNDGSTTLVNQSILNIGWANNGVDPAIYIDQALNQTIPTGTAGRDLGFESLTRVEIDQDMAGNRIGHYIDASQQITNSSYFTPGAFQATGTDVMVFVTKKVGGTRVANAGSATLPPATNGMGMIGMGGGGGGMQTGVLGAGMIGGGAGGTVNWSAGDDLSMTWNAQNCIGCADPNLFGGMGGGGGGGGGGGMGGATLDALFSYQTFDNLVDANDPIATMALGQTSPFDWPDPPFGPQTYAAP